MHHSNPPPTSLPHPTADSDPHFSHSPLQTSLATTSPTMSDIFSTTPSPPSSPTSHNPTITTPSSTTPPTTATNDAPSDIPRLRTTHSTAGYRDGIAFSKETTIQAGFDEGYALGATVAMRAGWVLGVLEGLVTGRRRSGEDREGDGQQVGGMVRSKEEKEREKEGERKRLERMLVDARAELSVEGLFGKRYWGPDGVWRFEVVGAEEEGEVTFGEVAGQHPVVRRWVGVVEREAARCGVGLRGFEGEEWERGRVGG